MSLYAWPCITVLYCEAHDLTVHALLLVQNPKGKDKFVEIQEAYSILSDPEKKRQYDYGGANVSWPRASCLLFSRSQCVHQTC